MARNGENLFRRGRLWYFKYKAPDGKYHEESTGTEKKSEARDVRNERLVRYNAGQMPNQMTKWTLQHAIEEHLKIRKVVRPKSYNCERPSLMAVQKVLGPEKRLDRITNLDLERYQATRLQVKTRNGTLVQPRSINVELLYLRAILRKAKLWAKLREDYKPLQVPKKDIGRALTPAQLRSMVAVGMEDSGWLVALCAAILSACATGLRGCEIKKLKLGNLRLDGPEPKIVIRRENTKSDAGAREYPLNVFASWAVGRLVERAELLGATDPDHYLLPKNRSKHNRPLDPRKGERGYDPTEHQSSWHSAWVSLCDKAGLSGLRFHDMRHTFITEAAESRVPLAVTQSLVGHMSPQMTLRYVHIHDQAKEKAVEAVGKRHAKLLPMLKKAPAVAEMVI